MKTINQLVQEAHQNAVSKGWWEEDRSFGEIIALIHSEVSEALEDHRNGKGVKEVWYEYNDARYGKLTSKDPEMWIVTNNYSEERAEVLGKPCGIPSELADIVIRVFDACGRYDIDLERIIEEKMEYNATRPQRHGGKIL
jgi:NTP pyrophosphatase (non-canonical NTP hydrolase)